MLFDVFQGVLLTYFKGAFIKMIARAEARAIANFYLVLFLNRAYQPAITASLQPLALVSPPGFGYDLTLYTAPAIILL